MKAEHTSQNKSVHIASELQQSATVKTSHVLTDNRPGSAIQRKQMDALSAASSALPLQKKANSTGLPDKLKSGIENLSGHSMDDVKVHYNSSQPAQLNAHAYAQGTNIHLAAGQEKHLPHEAWHVVQQKQGRVKPTMQMKDKVNVNDDKGLEKEADVMGAKAMHDRLGVPEGLRNSPVNSASVAQRVINGLQQYTHQENIPDEWVSAYLEDILDHQSHLSQNDIEIIYGGELPANVKLENTGGAHWDLVVNEDHRITTRHDGNCAIHVASAARKIQSGEIPPSGHEYTAGPEEVSAARTHIQQHYVQNVDAGAIKGIIAGAIQDKETLPETGFGNLLSALIEHTGKIDVRGQKEGFRQIRKGRSGHGDGYAGPASASGSFHGEEKDGHEDEIPREKVISDYLTKLKQNVLKLKKSPEIQGIGAEIAYGFTLIGDHAAAQRALKEFETDSDHDISSVTENHPRLHLAVVLTHVLEIILNKIHEEKPFKSSKHVAETYASQISAAFSLAGHPAKPPVALGENQVPPKTISGVLARNGAGGSQIFLGHNAKGYRSALKKRHELIRGTETAENLAMVQSSVVEGSLTEDGRDPLNCAECVPVTKARKKGLTVETDDVFPLSLHEGSKYQDIGTCENCQAMYGIEDRADREKRRKEAERLAEAEREKQARAAQSKAGKKSKADYQKELEAKLEVLRKGIEALKATCKIQNLSKDDFEMLANRWDGGNIETLKALLMGMNKLIEKEGGKKKPDPVKRKR